MFDFLRLFLSGGATVWPPPPASESGEAAAAAACSKVKMSIAVSMWNRVINELRIRGCRGWGGVNDQPPNPA